MLIVSTFEQTLQVEQALSVLERSGIDRKSILVVPLDPYKKNPNHLEIRGEDIKAKGLEVGMVVATALSVIGASIGFKLKWGPIVWGLAYAFIGLFIGIGAVWIYRISKGERTFTRSPKRPFPEIAVIVQCAEAMSTEVRQILWQYRAISVGDTSDRVS